MSAMVIVPVVMQEEFLSDLLVTAFDAQYGGGCWFSAGRSRARTARRPG